MNSISLSQPGWIKKSGVFLLFFVVATMVFAIITFSPWSRRRLRPDPKELGKTLSKV
jgi:hypothetical protein